MRGEGAVLALGAVGVLAAAGAVVRVRGSATFETHAQRVEVGRRALARLTEALTEVPVTPLDLRVKPRPKKKEIDAHRRQVWEIQNAIRSAVNTVELVTAGYRLADHRPSDDVVRGLQLARFVVDGAPLELKIGYATLVLAPNEPPRLKTPRGSSLDALWTEMGGELWTPPGSTSRARRTDTSVRHPRVSVGSRAVRLPTPRLWFSVRPDDVRAPFDANSPAHEDLVRYRPYTAVHVFLAPETFLHLTSSPPATAEEWSSYSEPWRYVEKMARGEGRFPPLFLDVTYNEVGIPFVFGHEGRHRALAAWRVGLRAVPVILYMRPERRVTYAHGGEGYDPEFDGPTIEDDEVAQTLTAGRPITIRSQDFRTWPKDHSEGRVPRGMLAPAPIRVVPLDPSGVPLRSRA